MNRQVNAIEPQMRARLWLNQEEERWIAEIIEWFIAVDLRRCRGEGGEMGVKGERKVGNSNMGGRVYIHPRCGADKSTDKMKCV